MSTSTHRWRMILIMLATMIIAAGLMIMLLASGLADPPRAGPLRWSAESLDDWPLRIDSQDLRTYRAPGDLPSNFTLELTATNTGSPDSAWGIALHGSLPLVILIDNQGYFSISPDEQTHWINFLHIHPGRDNKLYLDAPAGGTATLRINDEIAWEGEVRAVDWSVALYRQPVLDWSSMALYDQ